MIYQRPLCIATLFYIIGIIMGLYLNISVTFLFVIILGSMAYAYIRKRHVIFWMLIILLGAISITLVNRNYQKEYQMYEAEGDLIKAVVVSDVIEKEYQDVYQIEVLAVNSSTKSKKTKWLLNVRKTKGSVQTNLAYGDLIEFKGSVEIPSGARNYMGFDYQEYLKIKKLYGNMTVKGKIDILRQKSIWHIR